MLIVLCMSVQRVRTEVALGELDFLGRFGLSSAGLCSDGFWDNHVFDCVGIECRLVSMLGITTTIDNYDCW
jgi:hypothetical protein